MRSRACPCAPGDAVMVGDSWAADIAGAHAAGIRPIWFNRAAVRRPTGRLRVSEIATLTPATS